MMDIKMNMKTGLIAATLALTLGGMAAAQDGYPPPGGGGPGGGGVISGKVKSIDGSAKTIKIIESRRGRTCTIHVADGATIRAEKTVGVGDLSVGDRIVVRGIPTGITASNIMDGDVREALPPPPNRRDDMGGPDEDGPRREGNGRGRRSGPPTMASASGKVTSVNPLTVAISNDVSVVIKVSATAKVHKIVTEQLSDIKPGDRIVASGDPGDDGSLDVDKIAVNVHMPPPPPGIGRREGPGRPGFGGPEMGDNGQEGFGGGPGGDGPQFGRRPPFGGPGDNGPGGPGDDSQPGPDGQDGPPPPDDGDGQS